MVDSLTDEEVRRLSGHVPFSKITDQKSLKYWIDKTFPAKTAGEQKRNEYLAEKWKGMVVDDSVRTKVARLAEKKGIRFSDNDNVSSTVLYGKNIYYIRDRSGHIKGAVTEQATPADVDREIESININIKRHEEEIARLREKLSKVRK